MKTNAGTLVFTIFFVLLAAALVLSAGCTGTTDEGAQETTVQTTEQTIVPTETATAEATETGAPEEVEVLSGTGSGEVSADLDGGVHLLTFEQSVPESGTIEIMTEKDYISLPFGFNESVADEAITDGKYVWSQEFMLEEGASTTFNITTSEDCEWTIDVSFPEAINGIVPQTFTGTGNQATPFFQINAGTYNVSIKSESNTYLAVHLIDFYGNPLMEDELEYPLAYHEGTYDGSVIVGISEDNNYLFNVLCNGEWTVNIEEAQTQA
jgi:hypothetical protein